jgi:hypothetical protein
VQFGSQWTKYLTPDVYCFSRHYRNARCFVALNRGGGATLETVMTDLPDGSHTCVLTGRSASIQNGELRGLELAPGEALVFSFDGASSRGDAVTVFQLNACPTAPGEIVSVIGNCAELGEWDVSRAVRLEYINGNTWQAGVAFEQTAGKQVTYKYMIAREDAGLEPPPRESNHAPSHGARDRHGQVARHLGGVISRNGGSSSAEYPGMQQEGGLPTALLINFNVARLQQGLRRLTNQNPKNSGFPPSRLPVAF